MAEKSLVFLSYSSRDVGRARHVAERLSGANLDVFWDRRIVAGEEFADVIQENLDRASCVVVLWSRHSVKSTWVKAEANQALAGKTLVGARLDNARLPVPFGESLCVNLSRWRSDPRNAELQKLVNAVTNLANPDVTIDHLDPPRRGELVSDRHLALVHTCWRTPERDDYIGSVSYRWDMCIFGASRTLDMIQSVTYYLHPFYEIPELDSHSVVRLTRRQRDRCFLLRQVASGHSLTRADVKIEGQIELVRLSRYVNLYDSAYQIDEYFN